MLPLLSEGRFSSTCNEVLIKPSDIIPSFPSAVKQIRKISCKLLLSVLLFVHKCDKIRNLKSHHLLPFRLKKIINFKLCCTFLPIGFWTGNPLNGNRVPQYLDPSEDRCKITLYMKKLILKKCVPIYICQVIQSVSKFHHKLFHTM